ncbi:TolC family protein [Campylobacter mucosalis]|uniref:TolC family protein n=1 Tax=Campylobacter mucosalis TaxID=202 RepID=UPI0014703708|nr:TolC family protein [Campylobacter mucosalis]
MKKISVSTIAIVAVATTFANAQDASYRIYVGAFSNTKSETSILQLSQDIESQISGNESFAGVGSYITADNKKILYVDTNPVSKEQAKSLLSDVKRYSKNDGAYMGVKKGGATSKATTQATMNSESEAPIAPAESVAVAQPVLEPAVATQPVSTDSGILTITEAIKTALAENPAIKESEYSYLQVGKDLHIAKNAYYPTLDAAGSVGYEKKVYDEGRGIDKKKGDGRVSNASLTLVENIYNGGADKNRINSQSARLDSAAYTVAQKADRLSLDLANAYLQLIHTKKIVDIESENVSSHEKIYTQIKDRAQSGFGVASEERQAGSRYTLAQSNLIAAQNNYEDAVSTFEKLYGKKVDANRLVMPEFNLPLPTNEMEFQEKAMLCNPSILVQRSNIAMAESVVKEKNAPFLPKLDLEVSGQYDHSNVLYDNYEDKKLDALLRLRYNLYNKGIDKLDKEKSQLAVSQEQQALDTLTRELKESLKFSWQNYNLEQKKMAYLNEHVEYAKATLDSYQDEFRIGRRDLINLLDAETEYNTALKEILKTEIAIRYAQYRILDNMGLIADSFEPGFAKKYIQGACSIENDLK